MEIKKIYFAIRSLGLSGIFRTIQYSIQRDRINKKFRGIEKSEIIVPGKLSEIKPIPGGLLATYEHANLEVVFLSEDMVRISWEPGLLPIPYTIDNTNWQPISPILESSENSYSINADHLSVSINGDGTISFLDTQQNVMRSDHPPIYHGERCSLTSRLKPEERIYGLGERAASLNLRPGMYSVWNIDPGGNYSAQADPLYICTPVYLSLSTTGNYLAYFENSYSAQVTIGDELTTSFAGGMLRYYVIFGSLHNIYGRYSQLVGKPFMPPRWSLGYHQCRWGYLSESDVRRVVEGFAAHDLPISAIHLDIDYMNGYRVFSVDPERFPDLPHLSNDLQKAGINLVATINPAVKLDPAYKVYADGLIKNIFCKSSDGKIFTGVSWPGWSVYPDFTNPEAREWWSEQYKGLLEAGISGFWHDMNEPVSMTGWGEMSFPASTMHDMEGRLGDHREAHNLYGLLMNKAGFEGIRRYAPDKRPWIFSRSGWAGLQRYAWNWTGDIETSWVALRHTISTILGLGLSGHAFSGVDIGGFSGSPDAELYRRWFQMASFLPLFRTHSSIGTKPREPWVFGEPTTSIIRNFLKLRYKLMPYFYTATWEACQTGVPPIRPIFWEDPNDINLWDTADEYMVGDAILIAPVLSQGEVKRQVILPQGVWYSFWDDRSFFGPAKLEIQVTQDTIPVFIKGGAVLPMENDNHLSLHIYPFDNETSSSHLFTDAGDGYEAGRVDTFTTSCYDNKMIIVWEFEGDFPFPYPEVNLVLHGRKLIQAKADNRNMAISANTISTAIFHMLTLTFEE